MCDECGRTVPVDPHISVMACDPYGWVPTPAGACADHWAPQHGCPACWKTRPGHCPGLLLPVEVDGS